LPAIHRSSNALQIVAIKVKPVNWTVPGQAASADEAAKEKKDPEG
jgi:hypothetical protein